MSNQPSYRFYVVDARGTGRIDSGWELREDALERAAELHDEGGKPKVMTKPRVGARTLDPNDDRSWERKNPQGAQSLRAEALAIARRGVNMAARPDSTFPRDGTRMEKVDWVTRAFAGEPLQPPRSVQKRAALIALRERGMLDNARDKLTRKNPVSYSEYWKRRKEKFEISPPGMGDEVLETLDRLSVGQGKANRLSRMYRKGLEKTAKRISKGQPVTWEMLATMTGDLAYIAQFTDDGKLNALVKELDAICEIEDDTTERDNPGPEVHIHRARELLARAKETDEPIRKIQRIGAAMQEAYWTMSDDGPHRDEAADIHREALRMRDELAEEGIVDPVRDNPRLRKIEFVVDRRDWPHAETEGAFGKLNKRIAKDKPVDQAMTHYALLEVRYLVESRGRDDLEDALEDLLELQAQFAAAEDDD